MTELKSTCFVVIWLMRYRLTLILLDKSKNNKLKHDVSKYITVEEMVRAEREILKHVQTRAFPEELNHPEKPVKKKSLLNKLDPIVIDGLLCVGGRLRKASLPSESKH